MPPAPKLNAEREAALPPVDYGLVDLPAQQACSPLVFDLDRAGHLHIVGSPHSCLSQTLRTLATAVAQALAADDVHLYGIGYGNGALNALTALPHGNGSYEERVIRLLRDGPASASTSSSRATACSAAAGSPAPPRTRQSLRLSDRQDYSSVGISTRSAPSDPEPGLGIRTQDLSEVQIAVLRGDLADTAQAEALLTLGRDLTEREAEVPPPTAPCARADFPAGRQER